ncbi:MAG: ammonium transporter [Bacteroidetes bacterium]|nr:ammonium transporter [Bacteroidota bacterium]
MNAIDSGDTAFMLVAAALVLFMTPGLAFFYGGLVRSKNVVNTMMMSFVALGVIFVQWILFGYSLSFNANDGPLGSLIGGLGWSGLADVGTTPNPDYAATIPHELFMVYQAMFAVITPALISGAIVERMKFNAYVVFILLWTTFSYDVIAHWVWGVGGWLRTMGALDFAGGTVVHINAGVSALVATLMLGPRKGFPNRAMPPHNVTLVLLGGGMLWFGWFGFNAGSALSSGSLATTAFVATNAAAASGLLGWLLIDMFTKGKPTAVGAITGAVAGLVAITPACGFVTPIGAVIIGLGVSGLCYWILTKRVKWGLDDSLDAFSVHGVGGMFGALMTGVFATTAVNPSGSNGLLYGNPSLLWIQLIGVVATIAYSAIITFILIKAISFATAIRSSDEHQHEGLDLVEHGEKGYHELV